jgi:chromosomal replication initiation ATPase DnaA
MKKDIFDQYVEKVCDLFSIDKDQLFTKTKVREVSDARQLLYYLCVKRPMQPCYVEKFMCENGYKITHSTILHGVRSVTQKVLDDEDYRTMVRQIENSVFI